MRVSAVPPSMNVLLNVLGNRALLEAAARVPLVTWQMSDAQIVELVKPTEAAYSIRRTLPEEVALAFRSGNSLQISDLCRIAGCSYPRGYRLFTESPELLVWLLRPAAEMLESLSPFVAQLVQQVAAITSLSVIDKRGRPVIRNAKLVLRTFELLSPLVEAQNSARKRAP